MANKAKNLTDVAWNLGYRQNSFDSFYIYTNFDLI